MCKRNCLRLLIVFFIVLILLILVHHYKQIYGFVIELIMPNVTDIITACTLAFSVFVFRNEKKRERIRATLQVFPNIRNNLGDLTAQIEAIKIIRCKELRISKKKEILKKYVLEMERFSVGVNNRAYDLKIVNQMSGGVLLQHYEQYVKGYIEYARRKNGGKYISGENLYINYEKMIKKLYKLRS